MGDVDLPYTGHQLPPQIDVAAKRLDSLFPRLCLLRDRSVGR